MKDALLAAIPLLPLAAAAAIGVDLVTSARLSERAVRRLCQGSIALSFALSVWALAAVAIPEGRREVLLAPWLESGGYRVDLALLVDPLSALFAALTTGFGALVARFAGNYMHREAGFGRFHAALALFMAAMLLLALGANLALTFVGWELAGVCSYLLIGFHHERAAPAAAATRAFLYTRIGDAGFVVGIFLAFRYAGAIDYRTLFQSGLSGGAATAITLALLVAAAAKSAQLPFTPWLHRAMEGPTPSSALFYGAVMVNAGVYLLLRVQPLLEAAPDARLAVALVGGATAAYGGVVSLAQTDVKGGLAAATAAQIGLMLVACGLRAYPLALAHMLAHALARGYQFLTAPSVLLRMPTGRPASAAPLPGVSPAAWLVLLGALGVAALPLLGVRQRLPGWLGAQAAPSAEAWIFIAAGAVALFALGHLTRRFLARPARAPATGWLTAALPWIAALALGAAAVALGVALAWGDGSLLGRALRRGAAGYAPAELPGAGGRAHPLLVLLSTAVLGALLVAGWVGALYLHRAQPERRSMALFRLRKLHALALHRMWLDPLYERWIAAPVLRLARVLDSLDGRVVDRIPGGPRVPKMTASPAWEEAMLAAEAGEGEPAGAARALLEAHRGPPSAHGHARRAEHTPAGRAERPVGVIPRLLHALADAAQVVEEHVFARAIGRGLPVTGSLLGRALATIDDLLGRPAVAAVLILLSLLAVLRGTP